MKANRPICLVLTLMLLAVGCEKKEAATPKALCQAVRAGDIKRVRSLVSRGVDVNAITRAGSAPLHHAAMCGCKDVAELLIAKGAEIDARDRSQRTPLFLALWEGHEDVARLVVPTSMQWTGMTIHRFSVRSGVTMEIWLSCSLAEALP